jgi:hypothetical protein
LDGNAATFEAYYDTTLDITWLADANYAQTSGFDADGRMIWADANAWAAGLNVNGTSLDTTFRSNNATTDTGYADADGWVDSSGTPVSEMGHMYYVTLGNLGFCTPNDAIPSSCNQQTGFGLTNTGTFSNVQSNFYWSEPALGSIFAWRFGFYDGDQSWDLQGVSNFTWAVRSGDVSAVPVPAAVWLFASGLMGLLGVAKRQR